MEDRKRLTTLKALELLQNTQEDEPDAESEIKSDADVYDLNEDNRDNSESESSSDNKSLVSESSNSEISDKIPKPILKRMKITFIKIIQQALQLQVNYLGSFGP